MGTEGLPIDRRALAAIAFFCAMLACSSVDAQAGQRQLLPLVANARTATATGTASETLLTDPAGLRLVSFEVIPHGEESALLARFENDGPHTYYRPSAVVATFDGSGVRQRVFDMGTSLNMLRPGEATTTWGRAYVGSTGEARYEGPLHAHTAPPTGVEYFRQGADILTVSDRRDGRVIELSGTVANNTGHNLARIALDSSLYGPDGRLLATALDWETVEPRYFDFPAGAQQFFIVRLSRPAYGVPGVGETIPDGYRYELRAEGHRCPFDNGWRCLGE